MIPLWVNIGTWVMLILIIIYKDYRFWDEMTNKRDSTFKISSSFLIDHLVSKGFDLEREIIMTIDENDCIDLKQVRQ